MRKSKGAERSLQPVAERPKKAKLERAKRPGQLGPGIHESGQDGSTQASGDHAHALGHAAGGDRPDRTQKEHDGWNDSRTERVERMQLAYPTYQRKFGRAAALEAAEQEVTDHFQEICAKHHCCSSVPGCYELLLLGDKKTRLVQVVTTHNVVGIMPVPRSTCRVCSCVVTVQPEDLAYMPSMPKQANMWISMSVLDLLRSLNLLSGTAVHGEARAASNALLCSATHKAVGSFLAAFAEAVNSAATQYDPEGLPTLKGKAWPLNPEVLMSALVEYSKLLAAVHDVGYAQGDPWRGCMVHAARERDELDDGVHACRPAGCRGCAPAPTSCSISAHVVHCRRANLPSHLPWLGSTCPKPETTSSRH